MSDQAPDSRDPFDVRSTAYVYRESIEALEFFADREPDDADLAEIEEWESTRAWRERRERRAMSPQERLVRDVA